MILLERPLSESVFLFTLLVSSLSFFPPEYPVSSVPARFKQLDKHENLTARNGSSLELSCTAFGDQPLSIQWMREVVSLYSGNREGSLSSSSSSPSFEMIALPSPSVSSSPSSSSSSVVSSLESRDGGERRRIRFQEKRSLETLTSQLILLNAKREDSRIFQCMASNEYGSDVRQIKVRVEEVPDAPSELQVEYKTSRAICIRWTPGFDGNSDIIEYIIRIQEEIQETESGIFGFSSSPSSSPSRDSRHHPSSSSSLTLLNTTVSGNQSLTTSVIRNLLPFRRYVLSVYARNRVGLSSSSEPLTVITDEEAPGGPPTTVRLTAVDATTIKVSLGFTHL